jgi:hypothetical protein
MYLDMIYFPIRVLDGLCPPADKRLVQDDETPPVPEVQHKPVRGGISPIRQCNFERRRQLAFPVIKFETTVVSK